MNSERRHLNPQEKIVALKRHLLEGVPVSTTQARSKVRIDVPEGGKLFVSGRHIDVAPGRRVFETPLLAAGQLYFYDMRIDVDHED